MLRLLSLIALLPLTAHATRFDFRDALQRNTVYFVSDGLWEKTIGLTTAVTGWVEIDPAAPGAALAGEWEVDTRLFQTGFEGRNDTIRDKFFKAMEFPVASFRATRWITPPKKLVDQKVHSAKMEGELTLRGVKKTIPVDIKLTYFKPTDFTGTRLGGQLLKVSALFDVAPDEFSLPIPDVFKGRYAKQVEVHVDAVGTDRAPQSAPALETTKPK